MNEILISEEAAVRECLKFFGAAAASIGFNKPLGAYSEDEAREVVCAILKTYNRVEEDQHFEQTVTFIDLSSPMRNEAPPEFPPCDLWEEP